MGKINKKEQTYYCTYCGSKMVAEIVGAENIIDWTRLVRGDAYNHKTGKRQYTIRHTCPHWKPYSIWNASSYPDHDRIVSTKVFSIDET